MEKKQGWDEFRKRLNEPPEMTDTLIRHKWPEEKPPDPKDKKYKRYLFRHKSGNYVVLDWKGGWWEAGGWRLSLLLIGGNCRRCRC